MTTYPLTYDQDSAEPDHSLVLVDSEGDSWEYREDDGKWFFNHGNKWFPAGTWEEVTETIEPSLFPFTVKGRVHNPGPNQVVTLISDPRLQGFTVKDSGVREQYANGFVRDTEDGKADFTRLFSDPAIHRAVEKNPALLDFLAANGAHLVPVEMLIRFAEHMHKGAAKYGDNNWRQARGPVAVARFARSFCRHAVQWLRGDRDEDHAAAIMFNVAAREITPSDEEVTDSE